LQAASYFFFTNGSQHHYVTVKFVTLFAVPPGVVMEIGPVVAPVGTVAVTCVSEFTVKVAETPLNVRLVAPVKLVPVIVTEVPTGPLVGLKLLMVGVTVNVPELDAVPPAVVMPILPVLAPLGTVAVT
jgi:hypothetical protein